MRGQGLSFVSLLGNLSNDYDDGSKNVTDEFAFLKNSVVVILTRIKFKILVLQTKKVSL